MLLWDFTNLGHWDVWIAVARVIGGYRLLLHLIVIIGDVIAASSDGHSLLLNLRVGIYWVCRGDWCSLSWCAILFKVSFIVVYLAWLILTLRRLTMILMWSCSLVDISCWLTYITCCLIHITKRTWLRDILFYRTGHVRRIFGVSEGSRFIRKFGVT